MLKNIRTKGGGIDEVEPQKIELSPEDSDLTRVKNFGGDFMLFVL